MLIVFKTDAIRKCRTDFFISGKIRLCAVDFVLDLLLFIFIASIIIKLIYVANKVLLSLIFLGIKIQPICAISCPSLNTISVTNQFRIGIAKMTFLLIASRRPVLCSFLWRHILKTLLLGLG